jgi:hypothetical protein
MLTRPTITVNVNINVIAVENDFEKIINFLLSLINGERETFVLLRKKLYAGVSRYAITKPYINGVIIEIKMLRLYPSP